MCWFLPLSSLFLLSPLSLSLSLSLSSLISLVDLFIIDHFYAFLSLSLLRYKAFQWLANTIIDHSWSEAIQQRRREISDERAKAARAAAVREDADDAHLLATAGSAVAAVAL